MKTQCTECGSILKIPDTYEKRKVKCSTCKEVFRAEKYIKSSTPLKPIKLSASSKSTKPPIVIPSLPRVKGKNLFGKIWTNSPIAFRTGFLTTLGVLGALVFAYYLMDLPGSFNRKILSPNQKTGNAKIPSRKSRSSKSVSTKSNDPEYLAAAVYLWSYATQLETNRNVRSKLCSQTITEADIHAVRYGLNALHSNLETIYHDLDKLQLPPIPTLENVRKAYMDSIEAEYQLQAELINVRRATEGAISRLAEKSNEKCTEATFLLMEYIFTLNPELGIAMGKMYE